MNRKQRVSVSAIGLLCAVTHAQDIRAYLRETTERLESVTFKAGMSELGLFSSVPNAVFKPSGTGPFPAVVLGHACGGADKPHIRQRMRELLDAGFAVMALDSLGPRGLTQCRGQQRVRSTATVMDAYRALAHLGSLAAIDKSRIYFSGYSWGGVAAPVLASPQSAEVFGSGERYRAIVANYGGCSFQAAANAPRIHYLVKDTDRPILMLMAERDKEFKPADCFPLLDELKAAGQPVSWHIYAGVHHAWDQAEQGGQNNIVTGWGETNVYLYDAAATRDSTRRMIEFFNANR